MKLKCGKCGHEQVLQGDVATPCARCGAALAPPARSAIPPPPPIAATSLTSGGAASRLPSTLPENQRPPLDMRFARARSPSNLPTPRTPAEGNPIPAAGRRPGPPPAPLAAQTAPAAARGTILGVPPPAVPPAPSHAPAAEPPGPPGVAGLDLGLFELPDGAGPDLPAPREAVPRPDLPAPREAVPRPDLPAPREAVPRPDLPAPREAVPRPDLPAPREAIPRPAGLPAPREAIPRPAGLPAPREAIPRPPGLPVSRTQSPREADLPAARADVPMPGANSGPLRLGRIGVTPKPDVLPEVGPAGSGSPLAPLDLGLDLDLGGAAPAVADPPVLAAGQGSTMYGVGPAPAAAGWAPGPMPSPDGPGDSDLGFTLAIEGAEAGPTDASGTVRPQSVLPAIEVSTGVLEDSVPLLQPHQQAPARSETTAAPAGRRRPSLKLLALAGGGVAVLAAAGVVLLGGGQGPSPALEQLLGEHRSAIDRDLFSAYGLGARALLDAVPAAQGKDADALRAQAAEYLLLAHLGRDGREELRKQAEAAVTEVVTGEQMPLLELRARALVEIAAGKPQRVDQLVAEAKTERGVPLVLGLRHLRGGNPLAAAQALQDSVRQEFHPALSRYLLGRAFEGIGENKRAQEEYQAVLKVNPDHLGAHLGLLRLADLDPVARREQAEALLARRADLSSPAERAAVLVFAGQAARVQGRLPEAARAFQQALAVEPRHAPANIALGESYLREGRAAEALARFEALGKQAHDSADGKFGLGGALVASGRIVDGLALVEQAAKQWPQDPRAAFFRGWAAEVGQPPSPAEAMKQYRAALEQDPRFVDASLRLAALLQRQKQVQEALTVLKAAEQAGAPPTMLQIAWGEALIVAQQAQRAEDVFRKALAGDGKLIPARLGLAEALRAQGRLGEAKLELEEALVQEPAAEGLREKLGALALQLGDREEALRFYKEALETGKAAATVHVELARVAMDLGQLELAEQHLTRLADEAPGTPGCLFTLGRLRELQGNLGLALQEYRRATQFENTPALQLALGKVLVKGGREEDALTALRQAESLAEARLELGRILLRRNNVEQAMADLTAAITIDPQMEEAHVLLGNAYDYTGESARAAAAWQAALKVSPGHIEANYRLGRLKMDQGKPREALEFLRKAARAPADKAWAADVFFQLGYAELNTGSKAAARAALSRYLELEPKDSPARPAIEKLVEELGR